VHDRIEFKFIQPIYIFPFLMIRLKSIIILVSFIAIIAFSNSGYLFEVESIENLENRNMAKCPKLILSNLDPFPREFEKYYVDNFNFRQTLLEWNKYLKVNVFKESPHKSVIIGSDGFLFAEKYINTYTHQRTFSENEINMLKEEFTRRVRWLQSINVKHYLAIVPTKFNVYSEKLPFHVRQLTPTSQTTQFIDAVSGIEGMNLINLKDTLLQAAQILDERLYYNTDQHWNQFGAYVAYSKILNEIRKDFPQTPATSLDAMRISSEKTKGTGLAKTILMQEEFPDKEIQISPRNKIFDFSTYKYAYPIPEKFPYKNEFQVHYKSHDESLPKILFIRDSYSNNMLDFFGMSFSESILIWDNWNYKLNEEIVKREKPDIILTLIIEANLEYILYKHPNEREE